MHDVAEGKTAARIKTGQYGLARVSGGKATASRTVALVSAIFTYGVRQGLCKENPVHGVIRFADGRRDRRLTDDEYLALGSALRQGDVSGLWPPSLSTIKFLLLTGWRSAEATDLRWSEIDFSRRTARLGDTKTGLSIRPLSRAACDLLKTLPRIEGKRVFPATRGGDVPLALIKFWRRIARLGGLPADVTPHVLRHSFASLAADLGYSEPTIAALVGHRGHSMTSRYVHAADAVLLAAADAVANRTAELMGETPPSGEVVPLRAAG
jgi:integrase